MIFSHLGGLTGGGSLWVQKCFHRLISMLFGFGLGQTKAGLIMRDWPDHLRQASY